nr:hypothetical protein [Tanacetum cinerariifolium]
MNPIATQQTTLDNALVASKKKLKIERSNARIAFIKSQKDETYQIYPRIPKQEYVELPSEEYLLTFIMELGYSGKCDMLSTIRIDQMHQPWRTFAAINFNYVALLWEDFMYQADNKEISSSRKEHMPYPRFTKVIIHHFISKDNTISMRNRINLHTIRDDIMLGTLKFVSKTEDYQKYRALIPDGIINQDNKDSKAYKTFLDYATRKVPPKKERKFKKPASPKLKTVPVSPKEYTQKGKRVKKHAKKATTASTTGVFIRDTHDNKDESDDVHDEDGNDDDCGNDDDSGNDDDGSNDAEDSEPTNSVDDENPSFILKDYKEEEQDEEYVYTAEKDKSDDEEKMFEEEDDDVAKKLYGDLNITQGPRDTDMNNTEQVGEDQQNASHELEFMQEEEYSHIRLTIIHDKTKGPLQSSFISSDFTSKLLSLDDPFSDINSLMNTLTVPLSPPRNKSFGKSTQAEEPVFEAVDTMMHQDQGNESGHIDDQPNNEAAPKHDFFQKPDKPQTLDLAWNKSKSVDFRMLQKWISTIDKECYKERQPPYTFDELMGTPIDFSAYVMNRLKIDNLS